MPSNTPLIIRRPDFQTRVQRTLFGMITMVLWILWAYLWLPAITAFLWIVGIRAAFIDVFRGTRGFTMSPMGWLLLATIVGISFWSSYNCIRYGKNSRRRRTSSVSKSVMSRAFQLSEPAMLEKLMQGKSLDLQFLQSGELQHVHVRHH